MPEPTDAQDQQQDADTAPEVAVAARSTTTGTGGREEKARALTTEVEEAPTEKLGLIGWLSIGWITLLVGSAVLAPILPFHGPDDRTGTSLQPPVGLAQIFDGTADWGHILGVNGTGRDMLSLLVFGARSSLIIAVGAIGFGMILGGLIGLIAGYFRGWLDGILSLLVNVLLAIPALVLALSLIAVYASSNDPTVTPGRRMFVIIVALGIVSVPPLARIARASTITWSEREFVNAAKVIGASNRRIIVREILPNVLPAMFSVALLAIAVVIVLEGSLSILGIGVQDMPSWGNLIATGRSDLSRAPHIVMIPSVAIFFTVLALNYLGDVIRARFDVRESML